MLLLYSIFISLGWSKELLVTGFADGSGTIRSVLNPHMYVRFLAHNSACGGTSVTAMSFDDNYVVSAGGDGVLVVHRVR